jgi:hypothetical protein
MRGLLLGALFALASTSALAAGSSAGYEYGGFPAERFDAVVMQYNQTGELFRIDGHCQSACTLFLRIRNVCIGPGARLLFHAAHDRNRVRNEAFTQHFLDAYNERLRGFLLAVHALDEVEKFYTVSGRDMIHKFGYRPCPPK